MQASLNKIKIERPIVNTPSDSQSLSPSPVKISHSDKSSPISKNISLKSPVFTNDSPVKQSRTYPARRLYDSADSIPRSVKSALGGSSIDSDGVPIQVRTVEHIEPHLNDTLETLTTDKYFDRSADLSNSRSDSTDGNLVSK